VKKKGGPLAPRNSLHKNTVKKQHGWRKKTNKRKQLGVESLISGQHSQHRPARQGKKNSIPTEKKKRPFSLPNAPSYRKKRSRSSSKKAPGQENLSRTKGETTKKKPQSISPHKKKAKSVWGSPVLD